MNAAKDILQMALDQMDLSPTIRQAWFSKIEAVSFENDRLLLRTPVLFHKEIIDARFLDPMQQRLSELFGTSITVEVLTGDEQAAPQAASTISPDNEYTFENFIVGSSNRFAHAAAIAVANDRGRDYNPLFIYGQPGLGKTHLLHAIGNVMRKNHPQFRIIYVKGEDFTNELITAIQESNVPAFRGKYRMADLLLIDDIQFIAGKERTQEEFFHTFNTLYEAGKQIVLTSDRPPKEMSTLEDRMRSRFENGVLADIQAPDLETRMAIISAKAQELGCELPQDVMYEIAENLKSNVRQLQGTIKKIKAKHELGGEPVTIQMAQSVIDEVKSINPGLNPTPQMILKAVSSFYSVPVDQILANKRSKETVVPRQMAMYLVRKLTSASLPEIGKVFGRDHTTVMHACNKIEDARKQSAETDDIINTLIENIQNL